MKKNFTALTAAALLAGCGGYTPSEETKPAENTPEASAPAETASAEPAPFSVITTVQRCIANHSIPVHSL